MQGAVPPAHPMRPCLLPRGPAQVNSQPRPLMTTTPAATARVPHNVYCVNVRWGNVELAARQPNHTMGTVDTATAIHHEQIRRNLTTCRTTLKPAAPPSHSSFRRNRPALRVGCSSSDAVTP